MKFSMQDGRAFTDYTPDCIMNQNIQKMYKINDSDNSSYRKFLQHNAEKLMSDFQSKNSETCPVCKSSKSQRPYKPMTDEKPFF